MPLDKNYIKEQPLWIFIAGPSLNSIHQLQLLAENIQSFEGKKVETSTYNQIFRPKFHEDYELKESDVPAFLFLSSTTRVTIPHLLFREDSPMWPIIKDYTEFLPLSPEPLSSPTPTTPPSSEADASISSKAIVKSKKTYKQT